MYLNHILRGAKILQHHILSVLLGTYQIACIVVASNGQSHNNFIFIEQAWKNHSAIERFCRLNCVQRQSQLQSLD